LLAVELGVDWGAYEQVMSRTVPRGPTVSAACARRPFGRGTATEC
jgi:hypothetical protein